MSPIIGITTYGRDDKNHFTLPAEYSEAVHRAGGTAILLPPDAPAIERWLDVVDGFILAGGGDLDPEHYDGPDHDAIYMVDRERDATELALVRGIVESQQPTLGICRGVQTLNVALGGSVHAHLPDVVGETVRHRLPPRQPTPHQISLDADSRLASITGEIHFAAPSWHHQAIDRVAEPLTVVGRAPDGVIEAVEMPSHPWLVAVQWHPELSAAVDPIQQKIFDALVRAAAQRRT